MNIAELAKQIEKQLKNYSQYVTEKTIDEIIELLESNNYYYTIGKNGEVLASMYKLPLLDNPKNQEEQIYRIGGLTNNGKIAGKKATIELLIQVVEKNNNMIAKTENLKIGKILEKKGFEKLNYHDCLNKYPLFLNAYINKSSKSKEYYQTQIFYVKVKN